MRRGSQLELQDVNPIDMGRTPNARVKSNLSNFTPISKLKYSGAEDREGRGNLQLDIRLQNLMDTQISNYSRTQLDNVRPGLAGKVERKMLKINLKNDMELPVFGDSLSRMPQKKDIQLEQMRDILPTLNKDQIRMLNYENKLNVLREK